MSDHKRFSDRLIAAEQVDEKRKERYAMELRKILNQTLTPARRIAYVVGAVLGLLFAVDFGVLTVTLHITGQYAAWGRAMFGALTALGLGWTIIAGRIAIRGALDRRADLLAITRLLWGYFLLFFFALLFAGWLDLKYGSGKWSVFLGVIGLSYLVTGALIVIRNSVHQSELRVREKLLEIQLRLVEMDEKMERR